MPELPPSLPPACEADTAPALPLKEDKKPDWYSPPDSKVKATAIKIVAMRQAGMNNAEIAAACGISEKSIRPYVWRASKNGWITLDDPSERLEFQIMHKVVRNLDEALDDPNRHVTSGMTVGQQVAVEVAKGTLFKKFDTQQAGVQNSTIVAVRIEMPENGVRPQIREGNDVGGTPAHVIDAETVDGL